VEPILEPAPWLTGERVGLRAPLLEDVAEAAAWFIPEGPDDPASIERALLKREAIPWGVNPVITLVAIDGEDGSIAGGVVATRSANRTCRLEVKVSVDRDDREFVLQDVFTMVVPWLLEELGLMTVVLETPADEHAMIAAAEAAGMTEVLRRREHVVRPHRRVDLLQLERVNPEWGRHAG
jgi:RimJ/RimL family protein N-acetyltransferase